MRCQDVIHNIHEIYEKFRTPYNIREHMIQAGSIGALLAESWDGNTLDRDFVIATLLLHDIGNTVRVDFESEFGIRMLGSEAARVDYWRKVKEETIQAYGAKDTEATDNMLIELGVEQRIRDILDKKEKIEHEPELLRDDWNLIIVTYADGRAGPFGVMSLEERQRELQQRAISRGYTVNQLDPLFNWLIQAEDELFSYTDLQPEDVTNEALLPYIEGFTSAVELPR